jgi:hypothetical protein
VRKRTGLLFPNPGKTLIIKLLKRNLYSTLYGCIEFILAKSVFGHIINRIGMKLVGGSRLAFSRFSTGANISKRYAMGYLSPMQNKFIKVLV